MESKQLEN